MEISCDIGIATIRWPTLLRLFLSCEIFDDIIHWETLLEITKTCEMTFFKYQWDELFKQGVKARPKLPILSRTLDHPHQTHFLSSCLFFDVWDLNKILSLKTVLPSSFSEILMAAYLERKNKGIRAYNNALTHLDTSFYTSVARPRQRQTDR